MAEEKRSGSEWDPVIFIVGLLAALFVLWLANGGPERDTLRGLFLEPPPPIGTGEVYGPGSTSTNNQ